MLTQIIPRRLLFARRPGHAVEAVLGGVANHALEREGDPCFGVGDEGGGGDRNGPAQKLTLPRADQIGMHASALQFGGRRIATDLVVVRLFNSRRYSVPFRLIDKPLLPPLLRPVALQFLDEEDALAVGVGALVETDMGEDVGLVEVGGLERLRLFAASRL